jgi:FixJ family two-component response regulator
MMHRLAYILDDDPRVRTTVFHVLTGVGYDAREFSSPEPMLARIEAAPPELVVLDLSLGQSDAVEVIRLLAAAKYQGRVLLVSGHDEAVISEVQRIGTRHGLAMLGSLHKPFRGSDLVGRLQAPVAAAETPEATPHSERSRSILSRRSTAVGWSSGISRKLACGNLPSAAPKRWCARDIPSMASCSRRNSFPRPAIPDIRHSRNSLRHAPRRIGNASPIPGCR